MLFQTIQQTARPNEFGSQDAKCYENGEPAGPGGHNHDDTDGQQRKPKEDLEDSLGLLECLDQQRTLQNPLGRRWYPPAADGTQLFRRHILRCGMGWLRRN